jgi:hypothetical protein
MCCQSSPKAKQVLVNSFRRRGRKTFEAWKLIWPDGRSGCAHKVYKPGQHRTTVKRYRMDRPRGFHVYLDRPSCPSHLRCVSVVCHVDDIVRVEEAPSPWSSYNQQAVLTRIHIARKAWKEAGLPNVPRKRG